MNRMLLSQLESVVEDAAQSVPLYQRLFRDAGPIRSEERFRRLPTVSPASYRRRPLSHTLSSAHDACVSRTYADASRAHYPRVLSYVDLLNEYDWLEWALRIVGFRRWPLNKIVVLSDAEHAYASAELAHMLSSYTRRLISLPIEAAEAHRRVLVNPRASLVVVDARLDDADLQLPRGCTVLRLTEGAPARANTRHRTFYIYRHSIVGLLGIYEKSWRAWKYSALHHYIEQDAGDVYVTSLIHRLQPIVRMRVSRDCSQQWLPA